MSWLTVRRGERLPVGAILAGATAADGMLYIGKTGSEVGKYNVESGTDHKAEKVYNLWLPRSGPYASGEILCCPIDQQVKWERKRKGEPLPAGAFLAGHTSADGALYVGRIAHNGEVGKLNVDSGLPGGKCHNLWTRDSGRQESYDVLCLLPKEVSIKLHLIPIVKNLGNGKGHHKESKTLTVGSSNQQYDSKMLTEITSKVEASVDIKKFHAEANLDATIKSTFTSTLQKTEREEKVVKEFVLDLAVPQYVYVAQITMAEGWTMSGDVMVYSPSELLETTFSIPLSEKASTLNIDSA